MKGVYIKMNKKVDINVKNKFAVEKYMIEIWGKILEIDNIDAQDNFFDIGGHSLKAIILINEINNKFGVELSIDSAFKCPTIKEQVELLSNPISSENVPLGLVKAQKYYEATSTQRGIFAMQQLDANMTAYNEYRTRVHKGALDVERLIFSFKEMVQRHEALRASFDIAEGKIVQYIHENIDFEIEVEIMDELSVKQAIDNFVRPFDLSIAPLMRIKILKVSDEKHVILKDVHHIVTDRPSEVLFWNELFNIYSGEKLAKHKCRYSDYVSWQNSCVQLEPKTLAETYWLENFRGEVQVLELQTDYPRPVVKTYVGSTYLFKIDAETSDKLRTVIRDTSSTMYMVLFAACNVLLSKYTGQEDIIIGTPITIRRYSELNGMIGMFVNTMPIRNYPDGEKTFKQLLNEVKANALKALQHKEYPFDELVDKLKVHRSLNRNPMFDVVFQNTPVKDPKIEYIEKHEYGTRHRKSKFDITFNSFDNGEEIEFEVEYSTELFKEETIKRLCSHYLEIIKSTCEDSEKRLSEIDMITEEEKQQILMEFSGAKADYPINRTIQEIFEEQVVKNPDKVALIYGEKSMSYDELNTRANSIAHLLRSKGANLDGIIGLMLERSFEMIIGILGILKSGAGYLPIDPGHPDERINHMITESETPVLLTQGKYLKRAKTFCDAINLDDEEFYKDNLDNPDNISTPQNLAYVIYTSGSTGMPKGVMVEHRNIINVLFDFIDSYALEDNNVFLFYKTYTFDLSVIEILACLFCSGNLVILPSGQETNLDLIISTILEKNITHVSVPTSLINIMLSKKETRMLLSDSKLQHISTAGEEMKTEHVRTFLDINKRIDAFNIYGPTEATVYSTVKHLTNDDTVGTVSIGRPIHNAVIYILSSSNKLQPIGVAGELFIGGIGVSRGYLKNPELTAEKFVENPFVPGELMYKTGDLVYWRPDGNIEFLGRIDGQVKIRGFRIELNEVESKLLECIGISGATVLAKDGDDGVKILCAYIVSDTKQSATDIKKQLLSKLPEYMIPSIIIEVESIPLSLSGKVDRRALLSLESSVDSGVQYEAPGNETEERLLELWKSVLGSTTNFSVHDNFFDIGGHSLRAVILSNDISDEFAVGFSVENVFKYTNIREQAELLIISLASESIPIGFIDDKEFYDVTSIQRRMYTIQQFDENLTAYNEYSARVYEGSLDVDRLICSFKEMAQRHESFRTSFGIIDDKVVQYIHENVSFEIETETVDELSVESIANGFVRPFDLSKAPMMRVKILKLSDKKHIILRDIHHIITDGLSEVLFWNELFKIYKSEELPKLKYRYRDYVAWQITRMQTEFWKSSEGYWLDCFSGEIPVLELHTDYPRPAVKTYAGLTYHFNINKEISDELRSLMKDTGTTMYMVLIAVFNVLLSKYTGSEDIIIGSPVTTRRITELDNVIGMFANTIPLRNYPDGKKKFKEFLSEVKLNTLKVLEYQEYPFDELVDKLKVNRSLNRNPLFDIMFQNLHITDSDIEYTKKYEHSIGNGKSKFDIGFTSFDSGEDIEFIVEYSTELFKEETITRFCTHYLEIIKSICVDSEQQLSEIDMLTEEERHAILVDFNKTEMDYPLNRTVQDIFEEQVIKNPNKTALIYKGEAMSYGELNSKANSIAHLLRNRGSKPDGIIGIMLDKSFEMIVGILGILKSGSAYLPIDPGYPEDRIRHMLLESESPVLLTQEKHLYRAKLFCDTINLDDAELYKDNLINPENINISQHLAYVIYTSGSTGMPKGVMVEHCNILNTTYDFINSYELEKDSVILFYKNYIFDMSVIEIFACLLHSGSVVILPSGEETNANLTISLILENQITHIDIITSLINILLGKKENRMLLSDSNLQYIFVGGEEILNEHVCNLIDINNNIKVFNTYGPTETTVYSTYKCLTKDDTIGLVSIGKPISNTKSYILSESNKLLPIGVAGELCIGGIGVSRGYLNNHELTSEKFIENPFVTGERIYRTGDLARWRFDGNIEFLGRIDSQVKIRGYRIELSEVENKLLECDGVLEAVVLVNEGHDRAKYLSGYIVSDTEQKPSEIKSQLLSKLPEYMIPSMIIKVNCMPNMANGKIDRHLLLNLKNMPHSTSEHETPSNEMEERLCKLWEKVLDSTNLSVHDNFFDIGGHSLRAVILTNEIRDEFGVEFSIENVFKYRSIREQAALMMNSIGVEHMTIELVKEQEYYETTSIQRRMYTVQQFDKSSTAYNEYIMRVYEGVLDVEQLIRAFNEMIKRHESLRTSFEILGGKVVQRINGNVDFDIAVETIDELSAKESIDNFVQPFELSIAPLMRVKILKISYEKYIILRDIHHIITDGASEVIFWNELFKLYNGEELPELKHRYRDYAVWQNKRMNMDYWRRGEAYWLESLSREIPVLELYSDYPRPIIKTYAGSTYRFKMEKETVAKLRSLMRDTDTTMYMVQLAALNVLLSKYTRQEDIIIGSPVAARRHVDLNGIIGMFANTIALRNYPERAKTFKEFLGEVKLNVMKALEFQEYPFDELVDKLKVDRSLSRNPLFDIVFQNVNIGDTEIESTELSGYDAETRSSKFDISFLSFESHEEVEFLVEYSTELFTKDTIKRLCSHYLEVTKSICEDYEKKIFEIVMLTEKEKHQLLVEFNSAKSDYVADKTLQEIFEEQAEKNSNKVALIYNDETMSYGELNAKANSIAHMLRNMGAKPNSIVGIMLDKSFEMIICMLGILKSGAAYLPIDPEYPEERIRHMISESKSLVLLTQEKYVDKASLFCEAINLDDIQIYNENMTNPDKVNTPQDIAYVIYTSGSTGMPKGATIEHRNVSILIETGRELFEITPNDIWTMFHSYNFDFSVWEMYGALLLGGKLVIVSKETAKDVRAYRELLYKEKVTILNQTPQAFYMLSSRELGFNEDNLYVDRIIFGGEALEFAQLRGWHNKYPDTKIINMYGITETTVHVTYKLITHEEIELGKNSVGVPLPTYTLFIVDNDLNPLPIGVAGEIVVGGSGLARGYLNRPELTAEKFVEIPFIPGERMYRSGDLARSLPDGNIEYLGRIDNQVKIRGYRIELNEIEARLLECDGIREAVVLAKEGSGGINYLCGYVVSEIEKEVAKIKSQLMTKLPEYMIPSALIKVQSMPITPNGKVDRRALLSLEVSIDGDKALIEAPSNETEARLLKLWEKVLEGTGIGVNDNFFDVGGHSLRAVILMNEISEEFGIRLGIEDMFKSPTIRMMSEALSAGDFNKEPYIILNNKIDTRTIFAFPPHGSYGLVYKSLSEIVGGYRIVSFDFHTDDNLISYYANKICEIKANKNISILAYSAGGVLAFEVASVLEQREREVDSIILIDSYVNSYENSKFSMEYIENLNYGAKEISNVINYFNYYSSRKITTSVNANIHLIKAEDRGFAANNYYNSLTSKKVRVYEGSGEHLQMLNGENLIKNSKIIKGILDKDSNHEHMGMS